MCILNKKIPTVPAPFTDIDFYAGKLFTYKEVANLRFKGVDKSGKIYKGNKYYGTVQYYNNECAVIYRYWLGELSIVYLRFEYATHQRFATLIQNKEKEATESNFPQG